VERNFRIDDAIDAYAELYRRVVGRGAGGPV
jgi:hypothetical protein